MASAEETFIKAILYNLNCPEFIEKKIVPKYLKLYKQNQFKSVADLIHEAKKEIIKERKRYEKTAAFIKD